MAWERVEITSIASIPHINTPVQTARNQHERVGMPAHANDTAVVLELLSNAIGVIVVDDDSPVHAGRGHPVELFVEENARCDEDIEMDLKGWMCTFPHCSSALDLYSCVHILPIPIRHPIQTMSMSMPMSMSILTIATTSSSSSTSSSLSTTTTTTTSSSSTSSTTTATTLWIITIRWWQKYVHDGFWHCSVWQFHHELLSHSVSFWDGHLHRQLLPDASYVCIIIYH